MIEDAIVIKTPKSIDKIATALFFAKEELEAEDVEIKYKGGPFEKTKLQAMVLGKQYFGMRTAVWEVKIYVVQTDAQNEVTLTALGTEVETTEGESWTLSRSIFYRDKIITIISN